MVRAFGVIASMVAVKPIAMGAFTTLGAAPVVVLKTPSLSIASALVSAGAGNHRHGASCVKCRPPPGTQGLR